MSAPALVPPPAPREARTAAVFFESIFVHDLQAAGAFAQELKAAGFDPARMEVSYPAPLFLRCLELAQRHRFPRLSQSEAHRELGRSFARGLGHTLLGKVIVIAVPLLGPVRYLRRFPEHMKMSSGKHARVLPVQKGEREFVMEFHAAPVLPHFVAGVLEMGLRAARVEPTLDVQVQGPERFDIHITW